MIKKVFLDDEREPLDDSWYVIRTPTEFFEYVENFGCPDVISFDHDLGHCETRYDLAKWIVERDLESENHLSLMGLNFSSIQPT